MTLSTSAYIITPTNPEKVFLHLLSILEADPAFVPCRIPENRGSYTLGQAGYSHIRKGDEVVQRDTGIVLWTQEESVYRSTIGQGLAAILEVEYASDGPLTSDYGIDSDYRPVDSPDAWCVKVSFDTAYSYLDANGASCNDLHAFLLTALESFLGETIKWVWEDECRGTCHHPSEISLLGDPSISILNGVSK